MGPEDVSLLERCPHFRGCYVQASMELGPDDVSTRGSLIPFQVGVAVVMAIGNGTSTLGSRSSPCS